MARRPQMTSIEKPMSPAADAMALASEEQLDFEFDLPDEEAPVFYSETDDGSLEIDFDGDDDDEDMELSEAPHEANLAEYMDEDELEELGDELVELVKSDIDSASEWREIYKDGLELLGFNRQDDETDYPFENACTITHPLLAESVVTYQSKARSQILPPGGPARVKLMGDYNPQLAARAQRVEKYMNYHIENDMSEYRTEHDRMLFYQGFFGSGIVKTYYDATLDRCRSINIKPTNFFIDYLASELDSAERYGEILTLDGRQFRDRVNSGLYIDADVDGNSETDTDDVSDAENEIVGKTKPKNLDENTYTVYEIHTYLDIEGSDAPYIVSVDRDSNKVLAIYRNWEAEDPRRLKLNYYTHYPFIPGWGFFGFGYLHLIGGLSDSSTKVLRQLIDAGTFSNFPGGFKAHGLRVTGDDEPLEPGEWREVNVVGTDLNRALLPLPYKEPSATLVNLLQFVVEAGQRFADSTEEIVSQSKNYGPVNTTLALMEASGRMFNAIHERLFEAQTRELKQLYRLIRYKSLYMNYPYDESGELAQDFQQDFNVVAITDPRKPSDAHRLARTYAHFSIAQQAPQMHNMEAIIQDLHTQLGAEDAQRYIKQPPPPPPPMDPITEVQMLITGKPVQPYEFQDQTAYIKILNRSIMQNPQYQKAQPVLMATQANIMQRMALRFKKEIQAQLGMQLPPLEQMPPQLMNQIAVMAAEAVDALLRTDMQRSVEEAAGMIQIDPTLMLEYEKIAADREKEMYRIDTDAIERNLDRTYDYDKLLVEDQNEDDDRRADRAMNREDNRTDLKVARMRRTTGGSNN